MISKPCGRSGHYKDCQGNPGCCEAKLCYRNATALSWQEGNLKPSSEISVSNESNEPCGERRR